MTVKRILAALECLMALWFAAPFLSGVVNAGNITGLLLCGILIFLTLFSSRVSRIAGSLWKSIPGKAALIFVSVIAAAGVVYMVTVTAFMIGASKNYPDKSMNIVVLGCKVKGDKPSKMLRMRLDAAQAYLVENPEAVCVVSGGKGSDEIVSEAQAMKTYLLEKGIDNERIIVEDKSENTLENLEFSIEKLEERGYDKSFAIVTDGFHQYRAGLIAKSLGAEAYAVSAKIANPALLPTYYVREWLAIAREYVRMI